MADLVNRNNFEFERTNFDYAWKRYREENKKTSRRLKLNSSADFNRIVKDCFKEIKYYWTHSTGGIYVKGLGYFTFFRPLKKFTKMKDNRFLNTIFRTHGYYYLSTHITNLKTTDSFGGFKIRRTYSNVRSHAYHNIINGRRYTINHKLIKEYIKKRQFI